MLAGLAPPCARHGAQMRTASWLRVTLDEAEAGSYAPSGHERDPLLVPSNLNHI